MCLTPPRLASDTPPGKKKVYGSFGYCPERALGMSAVPPQLVQPTGNDTQDPQRSSEDLSLRVLLDRVRQSGQFVPVWLAIHVGISLCSALRLRRTEGAGQERTEPGGPGLSLDDVTVTAEGAICLPPSWTGQTTATLEPTQVARILYELLTLTRLDVPMASTPPPRCGTARGFTPASEIAPWVPRRVDEILDRALLRKSIKSFTRVEQMGEALSGFLESERQAIQPEQVSAFVKLLPWLDETKGPRPVSGFYSQPAQLALIRHRSASESPILASSEDSEPAPTTRTMWEVPRLTPEVEVSVRDEAGSGPEPVRVQETAILAFEKGLACVGRGDWQGAMQAWQEAVRLDPGHRAARTNIRLLRKRLEQEQPVPCFGRTLPPPKSEDSD